MGVCASKPWEVNFRDICQRLYFACCKGQIIINATVMDDSESTDVIHHVKKVLSLGPCG